MQRIMRLATFVPLVVLRSAGIPVQSQAPESRLLRSRMASTGKLWATVKYFHPSLSESNPALWDSALLDAIPRAGCSDGGRVRCGSEAHAGVAKRSCHTDRGGA